MKYYDFNKYVSYSLFSLCSINVIFFITLLSQHGVKMQFSNVDKNEDFKNAITNCRFVYPLAQNVKMGENNFSVGIGITTVNNIYTQYIVGYHKVLQKVSMANLFLAGVWEVLIICVGLVLLYKSRDPSKQVWYLWKQNNLKMVLHFLSFFGFICSLVYFGYTLNFYVNMQNTSCISLVFYAQSYESQTIIGGIMCFISFTVYCITIRIKSEPVIIINQNEKKIQNKQWNMYVNEIDNEISKMIAKRIKQLPKINDIKPINMQQYSPPANFECQQEIQYGHVSFFQQSNRPFKQIDKQAYNTLHPLLSKRSSQKPPFFQNIIQQQYDQFGRVRKFVQNPVQIQQIQLSRNSKLLLLKVKQQQRLLQQSLKKQAQQNILGDLLKQQEFMIRNYLPSGKKPRLKLFKSRTNKAVSDIKKQCGYK